MHATLKLKDKIRNWQRSWKTARTNKEQNLELKE
jgi:hypothetical protein